MINSARLKLLAGTDERFKYPESIQFGCSCMASADSVRFPPLARAAKDTQESHPACLAVRRISFQKLILRSFISDSSYLLPRQRGRVATPRGDIRSGIT
jgi:hypothetical protein